MNIKEGKPYSFTCGGMELLKVLKHYGYVPENSSSDFKIVCPFHNDINPSMVIDLEKGIFFCFGCQLSGDAFTFVRLLNKDLNDLECLIKYFKILKSNEIEEIDFSKHIKKRKKQSKELYDISWDYYYGLSKVNWEKDDFDEVNHSKSYMINRGFLPSTLNKCDARITYNKSYQIIFPMYDNDIFKGWVCRTTLQEIEKKRKYLYNEGFCRAKTLVGKYKNCKYVFIVEGYMDRLKFIQYGVENVVAILGWKMSYEQEQKLKEENKDIVIISALDNDKCGIKGTRYIRKIFKNVVRFCYLKGFKDPGEMDEKSFKKMYNETMKRYAQLYEDGR